ncbi:MAG: mechanosensitive ion channel family protein [Bacillota bacterium]
METINKYIETLRNYGFIAALFKGGVIILTTYLILAVGKKIIRKYFQINISKRKNVNKIKTIEKIIINIFDAITIFIAAAIFLDDVLGVDTTSILTIAGVSGLAVGFASQTIIKDFLSGILLLMEDTITIGDVVQMNGYKGVVEDISLRSICLRDENDVLHVIPNNIIRDFSNFSRKKKQ